MPIDPKPDGLFAPTLLGIETAYLYALQNILQNEVDELNTVLGALSITAPIITSTYGGSVLTSHVKVGVLKEMWNPTDASPYGGPIRIHVAISDFGRSQIFEEQRRPVSQDTLMGGVRTLTASVMLFLHRDVFRERDPVTQAEMEEIALARCSYWLRYGVLNNAYYYTLLLDSYEQNGLASGQKDTLNQTMVKQGMVGRLPESYGGSDETVGLHFIHSGWVG